MRPYRRYKYIYPPRPEVKRPASDLVEYDNGLYVAQAKLDGSNGSLYLGNDLFKMMNRHADVLSNIQIQDELKALQRGKGITVLNGEYLNKNKKAEGNKSFNHKFCIFDIIVYDGKHLVGMTYEERQNLIDSLYAQSNYNTYLNKISQNIYRIKNIGNNFLNVYNDLTKIDLVEGLVVKKKNAKLELSRSAKNNYHFQCKFRKETKNYKF